MEVTKRNGDKEPVFFDKITIRLKKLIEEGKYKLDPVIIAQKVIKNLYNEITTQELDEEAAKICASMTSDEPEYGLLGGRICISNLHKMTPNTFSDAIDILMNNIDKNNNPAPILNNEVYQIIKKNKDLINSKIVSNRDYLIDFFGYKTLERAYLLKSNDAIVERPQYMMMRVSIAIHRNDLENAFKTYDYISQKYFTHASPTLFNAGTNLEQLSSCFLMGTADSIEGIFKTITNCAHISKNAGGIGVHFSNIRAAGSTIRKTNGQSNGIIPMLQVYNSTARYIDQGGRRPGSFAMYLEPWHADVFAFLELRKNTGSETDRARDLFLALWIPDLFMESVIKDNFWYLMCPDESPGLNDIYGKEFEILYNTYIEEGKYREKVKARDLWYKILESQVETGNPYILYKDHVNKKSNQMNIGTIKSSNLCCEIVEYSDDKETAVCNLASIALNMFVQNIEIKNKVKIYSKENCKYCKLAKMLLKNNKIDYDEIQITDDEKISDIINEDVKTVPQIYFDDKLIGGYEMLSLYLQPKYDFNALKEAAKATCINLNKIIDINYYPIPEAKLSNLKHRPIGIGVQGLADTYFKMRFPFESDEAHNLNKEIFETIYFGALEASMELSKNREEQILNYFENESNDIKDSSLAYKADDTFNHFSEDIEREYAI